MHKTLFLLLLLCNGLTSYSQKSRSESDSTKKRSLAAVPIVNYNRSIGFIAGALVSKYYSLDKTDSISPSSSTMLMGLYSTNKTYAALAIQQFYWKEDKWRMMLGGGTGNIFFQYFQGLPTFFSTQGITKDDGVFIDFETEMSFFIADIQYQFFPHFYAGPAYMLNTATTVFDVKNPLTGEKLKSTSDMNSIGYKVLFDNRNFVNYPSRGYFVQFDNGFIRKAIGSSSNFETYKLAANSFYDIHNNEKSILVARLYANIADGDVPFQGENVISRDDLRGYSEGKYRGNQVYAFQTELRQKFTDKWGMIAFAGLGYAVDKPNELSINETLGSLGLGIRYLLLPSEKINIGMDVGIGKDDWSLTFRIGESFGR